MTSTTHSQLKLSVVAAILSVSLSIVAGPPPKNHSQLHLSIHENMHNEGVLANAKGQLDLHFDSHDDKDAHEDLHLHLHGLDAGASYELSAQSGSDSNSTDVLSFTADQGGNADIHLNDKGPKHPHDHAGHIDGQLPAELMPVTSIGQLIVSDTNGAAILTADLTTPAHFEYMVHQDLNTDTIQAKLDINASQHNAKLHLDAHGLEANAQYSLAINDNVVTTATTKQDGHLDIHIELQNASDVFALTSVTLLDASSNTVVSATFP